MNLKLKQRGPKIEESIIQEEILDENGRLREKITELEEMLRRADNRCDVYQRLLLSNISGKRGRG